MVHDRSLVMVPAWVGQETCADLERQAEAGERPRSDYVELAHALDADVMDMQYLTEPAGVLGRSIARAGRLAPAQVVDTFLRRRRYRHIVARADRLGLPLALMFKFTGGRRDLVLISVWLSRRKKALFLSPLKAHSHLGAIINYGSAQRRIAEGRLGVPAAKLHVALQPVDERFWRPRAADGIGTRAYLLAVGAEARDYPTPVRALAGLDVDADLAIGTSVLPPSGTTDALFGSMLRDTAAAVTHVSHARVTVHQQLSHRELRRLYAGARFVVVPLLNVDFDAGVTTITEAMAMSKAVVVTRTGGQVDIVRDGETGLYVPPGDPFALRAALSYLLDNPAEAERMGRAGRAMVEARHTLDGWVKTVAGIVAAT